MKPLHYDHQGDLTIIPGCCFHYPEGEISLLERFVGRVKSDPTARVILLGDMMDQERTHRRQHRKTYVADKSSMSTDDRHNRRDVEQLAHILYPIADKIWGVLQGNHYYTYSTAVTSDQYLCELLDVPYCGPVGVFRVALSNSEGGSSRNLKIWCHHSGGTQGGRTLGGSVNALLRQENAWNADVYLIGHDHRRIAWRESQMDVTDRGDPKIVERTKVFARVGAMLKTYKHEDCIPRKSAHIPGYGEEAAYRPADLGWVEIGVGLSRSHREVSRFTYDLRVPDCQ